MVAGIGGIDRDDRQVREVLAIPEFEFRDSLGLFDDGIAEFVRKLVFVDRDQAEALRRERIPEHRVHLGRDTASAPVHLAQHQVPALAVLDVADGKLAPLLLLDRREPEAASFLAKHAEHQLRFLRQLLQRMSNEAVVSLFGAGKHPVADAERAAPLLFDIAKLRRRRFRFPMLRLGPDVPVFIGLDDLQHRHLRDSADLIESAALRGLDQPLVAHLVEELLQRDLVIALDSEGARDLALPRRLVGGGDEVEDLLPGGQSGGGFSRHLVLTWSSGLLQTITRGGEVDARARRSPVRLR